MSTLPSVTVVETTPLEATALVGSANDAISRAARELGGWSPPIRSADADMLREKSLSDARSRDQVRNDGYAQGVVSTHKDSIVGGRYALNSRPDVAVLKANGFSASEEWADEFQEIVEAKFNLYAESPNCWIDASRHGTFTEMVRQNVGQYVFTGEILSSVEWVRDGIRPYNTAVQIIDTDRLSNPKGQSDSLSMRRGVERNAFGAPIAVWIRDGYPNDPYSGNTGGFTWSRIPIRKPWGRQQVIHVFERFRPDQTRGISEMTAVLKEMKMTARFQDIVLQNAVVNATYAATIESELPEQVVQGQMGADDPGSTTIGYATNFLEALAAYSDGSRGLNIDGVKIPHLFPGTKLQLRPAGSVGGVGAGFEQSLLRHIASALGVSYEEFSRDYSQTNYSSARAAMSQTWRYMQSRKKIVADRWATSVYWVWLEEAIWNKEVPLPPGMTEDHYYLGQNKEALGKCSWIGASRGQIDELKETSAAMARVRSGFSTWEEECGRLGVDWREVYKQRAREDKYQQKLSLVFDLSTKGAPAPAEDAQGDPASGSQTNAKKQNGSGGGSTKPNSR